MPDVSDLSVLWYRPLLSELLGVIGVIVHTFGGTAVTYTHSLRQVPPWEVLQLFTLSSPILLSTRHQHQQVFGDTEKEQRLILQEVDDI